MKINNEDHTLAEKTWLWLQQTFYSGSGLLSQMQLSKINFIQCNWYEFEFSTKTKVKSTRVYCFEMVSQNFYEVLCWAKRSLGYAFCPGHPWWFGALFTFKTLFLSLAEEIKLFLQNEWQNHPFWTKNRKHVNEKISLFEILVET